jgi:XTP/dITP diphosphohydrolase
MRLLIATHNRGKLIEYQELLAGLPLALATLDDVGIREDVEETGTTFAGNARLKALAHARSSGLLTLADDSGLEVDALGGEPGIYSRRYAGEGASDDQRNNFLLYKIKDVPAEARRARFRCAIAIASPDGETWETEGTVDGELLFAPRGTNGFGYDPIFFFPKLGLTMAELAPAEKNKISHRARAAEGAREILEKIILPREYKPTDNTGDEA